MINFNDDIASNEFVKEKLQESLNGYLANPTSIEQDYNQECSLKNEYVGREILELLQNAVDAFDSDNGEIDIELKGNTLKITNNGKLFSKNGIKSIMYCHISPKAKELNYIGNKGVGFKSVLNWADKIKIYSGSLAVEFSEENALENFNKLLDNAKQQNKDDLSKYSYKPAIFRFPKILTNNPYTDRTTIELEIKPNYIENAKNQIDEINAKTLLFLNRLKKIDINVDGKVTHFERKEINSNAKYKTVTISKDGVTQDWKVFNKSGQITIGETKNFNISIGYNEEESKNKNPLYCYFKTSIKFPIGFLVNATLDLDTNRENLIISDFNKAVIKEIIPAIIQFAKCINENKVDYSILNLLRVNGEFDEVLLKFNFEEEYNKQVANSKIFPNVNDEFITLNKDVIVCDVRYNWASVLKGDAFSNLLKELTDKGTYDYIVKLFKVIGDKRISYFYSYLDLVDLVNNNINDFIDEDSLATLCKLFVDNFSKELSIKSNKKPTLLLNTDNKLVDSDISVFTYPADDTNISLPKFANITYISKSLLKKLQNKFDNANKTADLAIILNCLNLHRYDQISIISIVFKEFNDLDEEKQKEFNKEAITWLYNLNTTINFSADKLTVTEIKLLARNGSLVDANSLYFGKEYDEDLCENLYPNLDEIFVASCNNYDIDENDKVNFENFLKRIGVSEKPKLTMIDNFPHAYYDYYNYKKMFGISGNYMSKSIDRIDYILENAKTQDIVTWLLKNSDIKSLIENKLPYYSKYEKKEISSWLFYLFNTKKWIEVGEERFSPKQCTTQKLGNLNLTNLKSINIENYLLENTAETKDELLLFLRKIGLIDEFYKLDSESIYDILLQLGSFNNEAAGLLTKSIYNSIVRNNGDVKNKLDKSGIKRTEFKFSGMVFCKNKQFVKVSQARYLSQINPNKDLISNPLIDIPTRESGTFVEEFLFVKPQELKYEVKNHPLSAIDNEFVEDFKQFKSFVINPYRKDKSADKSAINSLQIHLCDMLQFSSEGEEKVNDVDNYSYVQNKDDKTIYLKIESCKTLNELKNDIEFSSAIADIIMDKIKLNDAGFSTILRNLYQKSPADRIKEIEHDFPFYESEQNYEKIENERQNILQEFLKNHKVAVDLNKLNFYDITSLDNAKTFKEILEKGNISLEEFNKQTKFNYSFKKYNQQEFEKMQNNLCSKYKNALFEQFKNGEREKHKEFVKEYEKFFNFIPSFADEVMDFDKILKDKFSLLKFEAKANADEEYSRYHEELVKDKDSTLVNQFLNNTENDSLLYFGDLDALNENFEQFVKNKKEEQENEKKKLNSETYKLKINEISIEKLNEIPSENRPYFERTHFAKNISHEQDNELWGAKAEDFVYKTLEAEPGKYRNLTWASENARKAVGKKNNPNGVAGRGYDILYYDESGEEVYVEVKSTKSKNLEFLISNNELSFAKAHPNKYKILMVINLESNPEILDLGFIFDFDKGETLFNNSKFSISADNYRIRCQPLDKNKKYI